MESHLLQMRGLKLADDAEVAVLCLSHLLQMRGLKPNGSKNWNAPSSRIFYRCVD